jgi:hypothetical protein
MSWFQFKRVVCAQFDGQMLTLCAAGDGLMALEDEGLFVALPEDCSALTARFVPQTARGHLRHTDQLGRGHPPVARDNLALGIDKDRVREAEGANARSDLPELVCCVNTCIVRAWLENRDRLQLYPQVVPQ